MLRLFCLLVAVGTFPHLFLATEAPTNTPTHTTTTWSQVGLDIDGESAGDESGRSVSLSSDGTIVAVGALLNAGGGISRGHVRVWEYSGTTWSQVGPDIDGDTNYDQSGIGVALSSDGTIVAIGAWWAEPSGGNQNGEVRVYEYSVGSNSWTQIGNTIDGLNNADNLGISLSISNDGTVVAAGTQWGDSGNTWEDSDVGRTGIYKYDASASPQWVLRDDYIYGITGQEFSGTSVALSGDGDTVVIGAPHSVVSGWTYTGTVRVYSYDSSTGWTQVGANINGLTYGITSGRFGTVVSISDDGSIVSGSNGKDNVVGLVRVYKYITSTSTWTKIGGDINGEDSDGKFGLSTSLSNNGNIIGIGASKNDGGGTVTDSGLARIYEFQSTDWVLISNDIDGEAASDFSGNSVSLDATGTIIAIGATLNDGANGVDSGHVRVYEHMFVSESPTDVPSDSPTDMPSDSPTDSPSDSPSDSPTDMPSDAPTDEPTVHPCYTVTTTSLMVTITVDCNVSNTFTFACGAHCVSGANITIIGTGTDTNTGNYWTWNDFQFSYGTHYQYGSLHLENVRFYTDTINGYAIYSKYTTTTMKDLEITGYSGRSGETGGGAMRIRSADYSALNHHAGNPSLVNVNANTNCRGFRIQDSIGVYVKDCTATDNTDNSFYFASGTYTSAGGCDHSTFDGCTATNSGQTAFMTIGGVNNTFKHCNIDTSRGAGLYVWNTNDSVYVTNVNFTNANTAHSKTAWHTPSNPGNTDDARGASLAIGVQPTDTNAKVFVENCLFFGGGVLGQKTVEDANIDAPNSTVFETVDVSITSYPIGPGQIIFQNTASYYDDTAYDTDVPYQCNTIDSVCDLYVTADLLFPLSSASPTHSPTDSPSDSPSDSPTDSPTDSPSDFPSDIPTDIPSNTPTDAPTEFPTPTPIVNIELVQITSEFEANITGISLSAIDSQIEEQYAGTLKNIVYEKVSPLFNVPFDITVALSTSSSRRARRSTTTSIQIQATFVKAGLFDFINNTIDDKLNNCTAITSQTNISMAQCTALNDQTHHYYRDCVLIRQLNLETQAFLSNVSSVLSSVEGYGTERKYIDNATTVNSWFNICIGTGMDEVYTLLYPNANRTFSDHKRIIANTCLGVTYETCQVKERAQIELLNLIIADTAVASSLIPTITINVTTENGTQTVEFTASENASVDTNIVTIPPPTYAPISAPTEAEVPAPEESTSYTAAIIGGSVGGGVLILGVAGYYIYTQRVTSGAYSMEEMSKMIPSIL